MNRFLRILDRVETMQIQLLLGAVEDPVSQSPSPSLPNDPLVNHQWANITHIAAIVLAICIVAVVGILSRKVEHAIMAALALSLILIGFFFLVGR